MRWPLTLTLSIALAVLAAACTEAPRSSDAPSAAPDAARADEDAGAPPVEDAGAPDAAIAPRPLPARSTETHCRLEGTRAEDLPRIELAPIELEDEQRLPHALAIVTAPGDAGAIYVVEQAGRVLRVDLTQTPATVETILDMRARFADPVPPSSTGLRGFAFHPQWSDNRFVFVHYVLQAPARSVIARIALEPSSMQAVLASERSVLEIEHPGSTRPGGPVLFDASGMLLVALGDGGADPLAVERDALLSAILRLDVSTAEDDASYAIPSDNPYAVDTPEDLAPEVFAHGFADPAACQLDASDGQLYCVDRGERFSELNPVSAGDDHGWPIVDGAVCVRTGELCLDIGAEALASYAHLDGRCAAIGGVPIDAPSAIAGAIAYGDACNGSIQGIGLHGEHAGKRSALGAASRNLTSLGRDAGGRDAGGALLAIDDEGALLRAAPAADGVPGTFPERLSETGCFTGERLQDPAPDLIPFEVRSPLWSDGTHKRRYMVVPSGAKIEAPAEGPWTFPIGSMMVKEFALQRDDRDPESVAPIETRFMLRRATGWEFHSYRWNEAGTDAERVREAITVDYAVERHGAERTQRYLFPDKETCPVCHSSSPGRVLGPRTEQLNSDLLYVGGFRNQLQVLNELEIFAQDPTAKGTERLPRLADPRDVSAPIEQRARSYLHSNCAHCHQPGGYSSPDLLMDLRYELPLSETNVCDQEPQFFSDVDRLIAPGAPERSALWVRMRATGLDRMPPVATTEVDPLGVVIMTRWIESLTDCPP